MFENENIDTRLVTQVAIFGVILVFVAVVGLQVLFYRTDKQDPNHAGSRRPAALATMLTEQATELHRYRWVDKQAGVVQVPIERAMRATLEELNAQRR